MLSLPVLHGCCTIQLCKMVGGSKCWPHTVIWEVCGNTLLDEIHFQGLNQHRWRKRWNTATQSYYAERWGRDQNNKGINVLMAREVLGMPHGVGNRFGHADHKNHDTLDNREENLRVATSSQSMANRRSFSQFRFKGIGKIHNSFNAKVGYNGIVVYFPSVSLEIEAGLMHYYAATVLHEDFNYPSVFPEDEMPSEERQQELWQIVLKKLREVGLLQLEI